MNKMFWFFVVICFFYKFSDIVLICCYSFLWYYGKGYINLFNAYWIFGGWEKESLVIGIR